MKNLLNTIWDYQSEKGRKTQKAWLSEHAIVLSQNYVDGGLIIVTPNRNKDAETGFYSLEQIRQMKTEADNIEEQKAIQKMIDYVEQHSNSNSVCLLFAADANGCLSFYTFFNLANTLILNGII